VPERHFFERLFIHETLVDIVLETADVQEAMKSLGQSRGRLYWQRAKQLSIEDRLETVTRMADEVMRDACDGEDDAEVELLVKRISRAHVVVSAMKAVVLSATGRSVAAGQYDEAAWAWCVGRCGRAGKKRRAATRISRMVLGSLSQQVPLSSSESGGDEGVDEREECAAEVGGHGGDSQEECCWDDWVEIDG